MIYQIRRMHKVLEQHLGYQKEHNREAEWLNDLKREKVNDERPQERVSISFEKIRKQCRKIPN